MKAETQPAPQPLDMPDGELLPCPFCGGIAEIERLGVDRLACLVSCKQCSACVDETMHEAEAIAAWNKRTPAPVAMPSVPTPDWSTAPEWATHHVYNAIGEGVFMEDASLYEGHYYAWSYHRSEWSGLLLPIGIDWRTTLQQRTAGEDNA